MRTGTASDSAAVFLFAKGPARTRVVCKHPASAPSQGAVRDPGMCLSGFSWTLEVVSFVQLTYCPVTAFSRRRYQVASWPGSVGPQVCLCERHCHRDGTAGAGLIQPLPSFFGGRGNEAQSGEVNCSRLKTWQGSWRQNPDEPGS